MDDEGIELVVAKDVDALLEAGRVVEVTHENGEPAALVLGDEGLHRVAEVRPPVRLDTPEEAEDLTEVIDEDDVEESDEIAGAADEEEEDEFGSEFSDNEGFEEERGSSHDDY